MSKLGEKNIGKKAQLRRKRKHEINPLVVYCACGRGDAVAGERIEFSRGLTIGGDNLIWLSCSLLWSKI